jgi:hypothetical protein
VGWHGAAQRPRPFQKPQRGDHLLVRGLGATRTPCGSPRPPTAQPPPPRILPCLTATRHQGLHRRNPGRGPAFAAASRGARRPGVPLRRRPVATLGCPPPRRRRPATQGTARQLPDCAARHRGALGARGVRHPQPRQARQQRSRRSPGRAPARGAPSGRACVQHGAARGSSFEVWPQCTKLCALGGGGGKGGRAGAASKSPPRPGKRPERQWRRCRRRASIPTGASPQARAPLQPETAAVRRRGRVGGARWGAGSAPGTPRLWPRGCRHWEARLRRRGLRHPAVAVPPRRRDAVRSCQRPPVTRALSTRPSPPRGAQAPPPPEPRQPRSRRWVGCSLLLHASRGRARGRGFEFGVGHPGAWAPGRCDSGNQAMGRDAVGEKGKGMGMTDQKQWVGGGPDGVAFKSDGRARHLQERRGRRARVCRGQGAAGHVCVRGVRLWQGR